MTPFPAAADASWPRILLKVDPCWYSVFPFRTIPAFAHWLEQKSADGVIVLDGYFTHSALDVHRFAYAGAAVIMSVREPTATAASWVVRRGMPTRLDAARRKLRTYAARQRMAQMAFANPNSVFSTFEAATENPGLLMRTDLLYPPLALMPRHSPGEIGNSLEVHLAG